MKLPLPPAGPFGLFLGLTMFVVTDARADQSAPPPSQPGPAPGEVQRSPADITPEVRAHLWTIPMPRFESWPEPPAYTNLTPPSSLTGTMTLGTDRPALNNATRDKKLYSFHSENTEIKTALALFAKANKLNIVPDSDVTGVVTLDVNDLPLERIMQALLEAGDIAWTEEDGLIRVRAAQTQSYVVDYLRLTRSGKGSSAVTLSSSSSSSGGGGQGGGGLGGGGGGGGLGGGGGGQGGGQGGGGAGGGNSGSQMNLTLENPVEFWKELEEQLGRVLTPKGKESLAINRTAGIIQVTDRPSALKRVGDYLKRMTESVTRQVDLEAKLYDVTLGDQFQLGVDWTKVVAQSGGYFGALGAPYSTATIVPTQLNPNTSIISPGGGFSVQQSAFAGFFTNRNAAVVVQALKQQGDVNVISQPRLRTLNNQTAIMKVGTDQPFFTQQFQTTASSGAQTTQSGDILSIITVGTVLAVTPQIAADGWITLDITPAITSFVDEKRSGSGFSSAPVLDIKQSSTIVRLRDGETIVMGGLIQNSSTHATRRIPIIGDIPYLGVLFQGKVDSKQKKELVIFLTPRIVAQN